MGKRWRQGATAILLLACIGCGSHVLPEIRSEADRLPTARRLYEQDHLYEAIELLKSFLTSSSGAAQVDEAIYLLGACYLKQREWATAANEFERLLRDYPESDSAAAGAFRLAEAWFGQARPADYDQEHTIKALEQWQRYLQSYPGHAWNEEARGRVNDCRHRMASKLVETGTLYLKLDLAAAARVYFQQVIDQYGDLHARADAELGLAICNARQNASGEALAQLREIETRYAGQPVAERAARERRRLERRR